MSRPAATPAADPPDRHRDVRAAGGGQRGRRTRDSIAPGGLRSTQRRRPPDPGAPPPPRPAAGRGRAPAGYPGRDGQIAPVERTACARARDGGRGMTTKRSTVTDALIARALTERASGPGRRPASGDHGGRRGRPHSARAGGPVRVTPRRWCWVSPRSRSLSSWSRPGLIGSGSSGRGRSSVHCPATDRSPVVGGQVVESTRGRATTPGAPHIPVPRSWRSDRSARIGRPTGRAWRSRRPGRVHLWSRDGPTPTASHARACSVAGRPTGPD